MVDDTENSNKSAISVEDADIWQKMTQDVKKMPDKSYLKGQKTSQNCVKSLVRGQDIAKNSDFSDISAPVFQKKAVSGSSELDRRTDLRLRRGQMPIEAVLDLHGFSQTMAYSAVLDFVQQAYVAQKRCVIIITGRGRTNDGVLRRNLPLWLREDRLASIVLKQYQAQPKDGGDGAFYVYLRKNKAL